MTEELWLRHQNVRELAEFVTCFPASRKARLYKIACYRAAWPILGEIQRQVVETEEQIVEGVRDEIDALIAQGKRGSLIAQLSQQYEPFRFADSTTPTQYVTEAIRRIEHPCHDVEMLMSMADYYALATADRDVILATCHLTQILFSVS